MSGIPLRHQIFYASCRFGTTLMINLVDLLIFWIYLRFFELPPIQTGIGTALGKLTMAIAGYSFGYISDGRKPGLGGRRKQFLIFGAPMLAISFAMLFSPQLFNIAGSSVFVWLLVWTFLFHLFYGFVTTPYQAWMPELAEDRGARIDISSYQNVFNITATTISVAMILYLVSLFDDSGINGSGGDILKIGIFLIAGVEIIIFLPTILLIPDTTQPTSTMMFDELRIVWRNKVYVRWLLAQGIISIGMAILNSQIILYITENMGISGLEDLMVFGLSLFLSVVIMIGVWRDFAKRNGNRLSLMMGLLILIISLPFTLILETAIFIPLMVRVVVFGVIVGVGLANYYLFQYALLADLADDDTRRTHEQRAGIYTGLSMVSINAFQAIGLFIAGFITGALQFMGPVISLLFIISIIIIVKTPGLDPEQFTADLPGI